MLEEGTEIGYHHLSQGLEIKMLLDERGGRRKETIGKGFPIHLINNKRHRQLSL